MLDDLIEYLVLPPGSLLLLGLLGLVLWNRLGRLLIALALAAFWFLSVPATALWLIDPLQDIPPVAESELEAPSSQAIVVLGGGRHLDTPEYGHTLNQWGVLRLRYAAYLHRRTGLPVIPAGGAVEDRGPPEGKLMQRVLIEEYGVDSPWSESRSRNTFENARNTAELLAEHELERVLLVTHALHMARAVEAFQEAGVQVVPAPTDFVGNPGGLYGWTPHARTFYHSYLALHELVGRWWYRLRYY